VRIDFRNKLLILGRQYGIDRANLRASTLEMRMCCANWLRFLRSFHGKLAYDYDSVNRMNVLEVRRRALACLSCDEYESDNEDDQSDGGDE
jgi:hypothetical protein